MTIRLFPQGYFVRLNCITDGKAAEEIASYYFRVVKK